MKRNLLLLLLMGWVMVSAQDTLRIMHYNLLMYGDNFGGCTSTNNNVNDKNEYMKTIVDYVQPDIVTVNELYYEPYYHDLILNNVFNTNGSTDFSRGYPSNFSAGFTVNVVFYRNDKLTLTSNTAIQTNIRDIDIYNFEYQSPTQKSGVPFHCVVAHLKAGNSDEDALERANETTKLMNYLNNNNAEGNYTMSGDFNVYTASEAAFQNLVFHPNNSIRFYDPLNEMGNWNNNNYYAAIHTQSTHTSGDCFSGGGMDDRFDFILISDEIRDGTQKMKNIPGSYKALGQDGQHFNNSLNGSPTNTSVPPDVLNALYHMSDHLPVVMDILVDKNLAIDDKSGPQASLNLENPVKGELRFHLVSEPGQNINCFLLNTMGEIIFDLKFYSSGSLDATLPLNDLKSGLYLLQFSFEKQQGLSRKVVVKHH